MGRIAYAGVEQRRQVLYRAREPFDWLERTDRLRRAQRKRVIRHRLGHDVAAQSGAGAGTIVDYHRMWPQLRELEREDASDDIGAAAGGKGNHHAYWPRRICTLIRRALGGSA